jgi:hypothetical protein
MAIKTVMDKVALIQRQLFFMPNDKKRHYVDKYTRIGEIPQLILTPFGKDIPKRKKSPSDFRQSMTTEPFLPTQQNTDNKR